MEENLEMDEKILIKPESIYQSIENNEDKSSTSKEKHSTAMKVICFPIAAIWSLIAYGLLCLTPPNYDDDTDLYSCERYALGKKKKVKVIKSPPPSYIKAAKYDERQSLASSETGYCSEPVYARIDDNVKNIKEMYSKVEHKSIFQKYKDQCIYADSSDTEIPENSKEDNTSSVVTLPRTQKPQILHTKTLLKRNDCNNSTEKLEAIDEWFKLRLHSDSLSEYDNCIDFSESLKKLRSFSPTN